MLFVGYEESIDSVYNLYNSNRVISMFHDLTFLSEKSNANIAMLYSALEWWIILIHNGVLTVIALIYHAIASISKRYHHLLFYLS